MDKKNRLRHNEYYDTQKLFDSLYSKSQKNEVFTNLTEIMKSEQNILLAYRNIKRNTGRNTAGVDGLKTKDIANLPPKEVISKIQNMFNRYVPGPVRRVMIPKNNGTGKLRPLGIPCVWDRLFQQCILQVLEPICEAKFHKHSYGFRPNRNCTHAIARMSHLINQNGLHHCVDVDIKSFFDNVNHGKLLKQMWSLGIREKKLLSIISALLKAEIIGEGIPKKGTPQGGILSPLLSNIVLNELDWWVSNQWETFETQKDYTIDRGKKGMDNSHKYRALKATRMKEMYIVRYADDFKILCRTRSQANKVQYAVQDFLQTRLKLEPSEEKSKIINLKRNYSEFLGIEIKAVRNGTDIERVWKTRSKRIDGKRTFWRECVSEVKIPKYTATSRMTIKAKDKAVIKIKEAIINIQNKPCRDTANRYNSVVYGIQNYYKMATQVSLDMSEIAYKCNKVLYNRLKGKRAEASLLDMNNTQKERYGDRDVKLYKIQGVVLFPIHAQVMVIPLRFSQDINNFSDKGRKGIHKNLTKVLSPTLRYISSSYTKNRSVEYHDNRISKFVAQGGKCFVTGYKLGMNDWHCHHITPYYLTQDDNFANLTVVHEDIHKLIHMKDEVKIGNLLKLLGINKDKLNNINLLREKAKLTPILEDKLINKVS